MGSPNHMAPELAAGHHRRAGPASDIFSLGTVLYELLTGRPPFLADSIQATLLKIRDDGSGGATRVDWQGFRATWKPSA